MAETTGVQGTASRGITCVEFLKLDAALVSSSELGDSFALLCSQCRHQATSVWRAVCLHAEVVWLLQRIATGQADLSCNGALVTEPARLRLQASLGNSCHTFDR